MDTLAGAPLPDTGIATTIPRLIFNVLSRLFGTIGLNTPSKRAAIGGLVGYIFQALVKPRLSYTKEDQQPKAWKGSLKERQQYGDDRLTWTPWWIWPLGGSVMLGVFI